MLNDQKKRTSREADHVARRAGRSETSLVGSMVELDELELATVAGGVRFQRNNLGLFTLDIGTTE